MNLGLPITSQISFLPLEFTYMYIMHLNYLTDNRMIGLSVQREKVCPCNECAAGSLIYQRCKVNLQNLTHMYYLVPIATQPCMHNNIASPEYSTLMNIDIL